MFLPGTIFFPLLLAILVDRVATRRLATVYRVILLIPAVIPGTLIFVLWKWIYNLSDRPDQPLPRSTSSASSHLQPAAMAGRHGADLPSLAIMEVWWGLGYHTIFFLAGLAAIPKDLLRGGAHRRRQRVADLLACHPPAAGADHDGPGRAPLRHGHGGDRRILIFGGFNRDSPTYTWTIYMYDQAFKIGDWRQGYAAAIGMIGAVAMLVVVVWLFCIFRSRD